MRPWVWIVVAACGGTSSELPPPKPVPAPVGAPTTCADAGVILRGKVVSSEDTAGPALEAAITGACTDDHWSRALLACIGSSRTPKSCLDTLPPLMAARYQARLAEWNVKYAEASDADDAPPETSCDTVAEAVERLSDDVSLEREWVLDARKRAVETECAAWHEKTKQCLVADTAPPDLVSCIVDEPDKPAFAAKLDQIAERAKKISAAKQKPATMTCAKVAATYYADAAWQGKLDGAKPAERRKAITGSRTAMQKACTADKWTDTVRACVATGGGVACFDGSAVLAADWDFPARATVVRAMPPVCVEFDRRAQGYEGCSSVAQETRDAVANVRKMLDDEAQRDPDGAVATCQAALEMIGKLPPCP